MFEFNNIKIKWCGHDTFILSNGKTIYVDPYKLKQTTIADIILITHNHFDHLSSNDIMKIANDRTVIIAAHECMDKISTMNCKKKFGIFPYDEKVVYGIKITAVPAYNTNKVNHDTKKQFHPKEDNKIGFIININGTSIYHAGDSDFIPEMNDIKTDVLLIPISGTYVMTIGEAVSAVEKIKPKITIPMHYGTIIGDESDARRFSKMLTCCEVKILNKE